MESSQAFFILNAVAFALLFIAGLAWLSVVSRRKTNEGPTLNAERVQQAAAATGFAFIAVAVAGVLQIG